MTPLPTIYALAPDGLWHATRATYLDTADLACGPVRAPAAAFVACQPGELAATVRDLWPARPFRRCELCDYVHLQESHERV